MEALPPIPTPPAQRWREFRIQVLPVLVFLVTVSAIIVMWCNFVQPSPVVGQVEAVTANVLSSQDGVIASLMVDRFQYVTNGQILGTVNVMDPQFLEVSLKTISADLKLMQARMELDKTRNFDAFTRRYEELLAEKLAFNLAQVRLVQTEKELKRMEQLYKEGAIALGMAQDTDYNRSDTGLDVARRDHELVLSEISARSNLVQYLETSLKTMEGTVVNIPPEDKAVEEAITAQQDQLRAEQKPYHLKAPIEGVVNLVLKHPGERVISGEPVLIISSPAAHRIIGYVRQPVQVLPTVNDLVMVRTRSLKRQTGQGQVLKVGAQFEPINPVLLPDPTRVQMGFPILVSLPPGMVVSPGELVDLSVRHGTK